MVGRQKKKKVLGLSRGFTLVELSLSMVFIAILSILIALVIRSAIVSYRRGITLNLINTVGAELTDNIGAALRESPVDGLNRVCGEDGWCSEDQMKAVSVVKEDISGEPAFGALCTGKYSYIWNSGHSIKNGNALKVEKEGVGPRPLFKLLKIIDQDRKACQSISELTGVGSISVDDLGEELLNSESDGGVVVYGLSAERPAEGNGTLFYTISLTLGTLQSGDVIKTQRCKVDDEDSGDLDYCAINKFKFAALASGGKGSD